MAEGPVSVEHAADSELARRAALGDREAFSALFHRHSAATFRYALHMLDGDEQDAQDATQDAWIKAWRNLAGFRGESALRTWLFRIVAREVLNVRRRTRAAAVDDHLLDAQASSAPGPLQSVTERDLWQALTLALSELPWRQRASWLLRELEDLSYEEIATILDTTVTIVRGQLHRARRSVALRMEQWQ